jgi:hypothetical protein
MRNFFVIAAGIGAVGTLASTTRGQEDVLTSPKKLKGPEGNFRS